MNLLYGLKRHELWSTNGFKLDRHFYPPSENFAFLFAAGLHALQTTELNQYFVTR